MLNESQHAWEREMVLSAGLPSAPDYLLRVLRARVLQLRVAGGLTKRAHVNFPSSNRQAGKRWILCNVTRFYRSNRHKPTVTLSPTHRHATHLQSPSFLFYERRTSCSIIYRAVSKITRCRPTGPSRPLLVLHDLFWAAALLLLPHHT
jgi:hypothetical protein